MEVPRPFARSIQGRLPLLRVGWGVLPEGVKLRSLGAHKLHGLPGEHRLYEVRAKGLATGFPPLRTGG